MADDVTTLLREAAADPTHTPDFDMLAARGRRQHLLARSGTALAVALALVVGSIMVWPGLLPSSMPVIGDRPTTSTEAGEVELPAGWQWVEAGRARFGVPGEWEVVRTDHDPGAMCTAFYSTPPRAVIGLAAPNVRCPAPDVTNPGPGLHASTITADARDRHPGTTENLLVNGWPATRRTETRSAQTDGQFIEATFEIYLIEGLDLYLTIRTDAAPDLAEQILATVAERHLILVRRALPGGVEVEVPDSWEIRHARVECFAFGTTPALSWGVGYPSHAVLLSCSPGASSAPGVLVMLDVLVQPEGDARPAGTGDWQAILYQDGRSREFYSPCHNLVVRTAGLSRELEESVLASVVSGADCS